MYERADVSAPERSQATTRLASLFVQVAFGCVTLGYASSRQGLRPAVAQRLDDRDVPPPCRPVERWLTVLKLLLIVAVKPLSKPCNHKPRTVKIYPQNHARRDC